MTFWILQNVDCEIHCLVRRYLRILVRVILEFSNSCPATGFTLLEGVGEFGSGVTKKPSICRTCKLNMEFQKLGCRSPIAKLLQTDSTFNNFFLLVKEHLMTLSDKICKKTLGQSEKGYTCLSSWISLILPLIWSHWWTAV